jgi:protein SCO1
MQFLKTIVPALALALGLAVGNTASAHSAKDVEAMMGDKEKYFQQMDREAPGFALRDASGEPVRLEDFRGKVVVLHFVYASCPDVCPLHAEKIAEVQKMVNQTPTKTQVQFVSVTTDPANDTAEVLRDYGPAHGLDPANWTFLTTTAEQSEDATRRLAEAYGHKFSETGEGTQVHGVVTHVIDKQGHWRANFHGLRFGSTNLVVYVNALANDTGAEHDHAPRNLWDKVKGMF